MPCGIPLRPVYWTWGHDFRTVQELLGHEDVSTMMLDTHAGPQGGWGVRSPVNQLAGGG